jgi:hypothetical protein
LRKKRGLDGSSFEKIILYITLKLLEISNAKRKEGEV